MAPPLYLTEADVAALVGPADAFAAVEGSLLRIAQGEAESLPRGVLGLRGGRLGMSAAVDRELGLAGAEAVAAFGGRGAAAALLLFSVDEPNLLAVVEAERLAQLRGAATSGLAARLLARPDARTLGVIGCGRQARAQVEALRLAVPGFERIVAYCRDETRLAAFCREVGAEPAEYGRDAAEQDVVVTATSSRDPVLRGEWLRPGALVCAVGATTLEARELDNVVVERASFVCCDSLEQARLAAGDLVEPAERGVLDWLEVHELAEVVAGVVEGRQRPSDIVLAKSAGLAAADLALAALVVERARARSTGEGSA